MNLSLLVNEYLDSPEYKALIERYKAHFARSIQWGLDGKLKSMPILVKGEGIETRSTIYVSLANKGADEVMGILVEGTKPMHLDTHQFADFLNRKESGTVFVEKEGRDGTELPTEQWTVIWPDDKEHPLRAAVREVGAQTKAELLARPELRALAEKCIAALRDAFLSGRMAAATRTHRLMDLWPGLIAAVNDGLTDETILKGVRILLDSLRKEKPDPNDPFVALSDKWKAIDSEEIRKFTEGNSPSDR